MDVNCERNIAYNAQCYVPTLGIPQARLQETPGDVALASERGRLAQIPEAKRRRGEKRGAS